MIDKFPLFTAEEFPPEHMICASEDRIVAVAPYILMVANVLFCVLEPNTPAELDPSSVLNLLTLSFSSPLKTQFLNIMQLKEILKGIGFPLPSDKKLKIFRGRIHKMLNRERELGTIAHDMEEEEVLEERSTPFSAKHTFESFMRVDRNICAH